MDQLGLVPNTANLDQLGLGNVDTAYWNLSPADLTEETIVRGQGVLADSGALVVLTGEFTGRSPKDRFIVCDEKTENSVWWGDINIPLSTEKFDQLYTKMVNFLADKKVYVYLNHPRMRFGPSTKSLCCSLHARFRARSSPRLTSMDRGLENENGRSELE